MEVSSGQEDMAFSDWSEKLEAGTSHWLPAYGFQQPSQLHEALLQHDYEVGQQSYVYLETIVEETSDDLRSESEYSAGGWPDTDSDAGSVIHLPAPVGNGGCAGADWSGSERDLAVPKKRRRRIFNNDPGVHDDDDDDDDFLPPLSSRSSSLLQFETLEKQCETSVFRTSASSEPFHSPSLASSFSFDSLETSRWRFSGSPDSLEEAASSLSSTCSSSTHISSSDDEHLARSFSSKSANGSYRSSLKSHRSFDSLVACQEKSPMLSGEFSQSLNNTVIEVEEEEPTAPPRCLYKTVECLNETGRPESKPQEASCKKRGQRSAENLSEDSGFGEHIPRTSVRRASSTGVFTIAEQEAGSEAKIDKEEEWGEVQANYSHWQSAPDLLDQSDEKCGAEKAVSTTSLLLSTHEEEDTLPESKGLNMNTVSTPNLYGEELEDGEYELKFGEKLNRAHSFKETMQSAGELRKTRSRGSNIQITTSFINLNASSGSLHSKVHFSPVVSEVSFRDRDSEEEPEDKKVGSSDMKVSDSGGGRAVRAVPQEPLCSMEQHRDGKKTKLGGFFQRFSLRRLSGRDKKKKEKKAANGTAAASHPAAAPPLIEDVQIIPLHGPEERKPPLPTGQRRREPAPGGGSAMPTGPREGLLETDLDSVQDERPPKTRSLLDLGGGTAASRPQQTAEQQDNRAKSMEFLLDKQAQFSVKPPENELQKVGERVMSEHELRVQRSLQRLNVPEWFKNSQVPSQGFLLKRHSEGGVTTTGWQGLTSKTTSLSSLGSRSPTGNLLSPSPTPSTHTFSRWSTNRLSSNPGSTSTSPSGSARSSFNYRQPYLGWRSQERIAHPRTPAERLAAGLLPQKQATPPPNVPNLSEVHSSIKEVTSAIVHYVSGANKDDRLSPNPPKQDSGSSRSASPRGSTSRFCWLESSFVGNRPVDVPETPVSLTATPEHGKDLYLDLNSISSPGRQLNDCL